MKYYLVLSLSMLVASCAVTELTAETEQKNEKQERAGMLRTKSNGGTADSLSLLSKFQSDVELMLLNQIHYRNGQLVLALSREDAARSEERRVGKECILGCGYRGGGGG